MKAGQFIKCIAFASPQGSGGSDDNSYPVHTQPAVAWAWLLPCGGVPPAAVCKLTPAAVCKSPGLVQEPTAKACFYARWMEDNIDAFQPSEPPFALLRPHTPHHVCQSSHVVFPVSLQLAAAQNDTQEEGEEEEEEGGRGREEAQPQGAQQH